MRDLRAKLQAKYKLVGVSEPQWNGVVDPVAPDEVTDAIESGVDPRSALAMLRGLLTPLLALLLLAVDASIGSAWWARSSTRCPQPAGRRRESDRGLRRLCHCGTRRRRAGRCGRGRAIRGLYMLKHAILYLALERWVFEWDARWWAVESSDE